MKTITHFEQSLAAELALGEEPGCPPKLANALRHEVFSGGVRIRPQLCLAVARACDNDDPLLAAVLNSWRIELASHGAGVGTI